jgi:hypothetical protein
MIYLQVTFLQAYAASFLPGQILLKFNIVKCINTTDFPVVNVHVHELLFAQTWQYTLCATLSANVNINYRLPSKYATVFVL